MKVNMNKYLLIGALCAPFAVTSCASNTAGLQASVSSSGEANVVAYKLGNDIQVQQLVGDYVGGMYRARVVVENLKKKQQDLQYQFAWFDANDVEVGMDRQGWTPMVVYGKDQKTIMAVAPSPEASAFRINIRDLKANKTFKTNFFGKR